MASSRGALGIAGAVMTAACFHPAPLSQLGPLPNLELRGAPDAAPAMPPPASWEFDERAAIAFALSHSAAVAERRDQEAIAEARIAAARQLTNPELHLGRSSELGLLGDESSRFVVGLRVFPDMPWALDARIAAARATYAAERAVTTTATRALAAQIAQGYAQLAYGQATTDLLARSRAVLAERRHVLAAQLAHNTATQLEVVLAAQDAAEIDATISAIDVAATRQRAELARLIGIPVGQTWTPIWQLDTQQAIHTEIDRAALEAQALARPELAELAARAHAAEATAYEERSHRAPWLQSLQIERSVRDTVEWAVSATISLPLFSLGTGKIATADAEQRRYANQRLRLGRDTLRQLDDAITVAEATGRRARALADQLAPASQQIAALLAAERSAAVSDPVKLLLLEERHVRAQRAMLDAAYDHRMAMIALEALTGAPGGPGGPGAP
jgi:outer membrane protein TolC